MSVDRVVQGTEGRAQGRRCLRREPDVQGLQAGPQDASIDLGEKERDATPVGCQHVAMLAVETLEQAFTPQAPQS